MKHSVIFKKSSLICCLFFSAIPIFFLLFLIHNYAVDIPYGDEWSLLEIFDRYYSGILTFHDLWAQVGYGDHRTLFPNLIYLFVGVLSLFNVIYEMYISFLLAFLSYIFICLHIFKNKKTLSTRRTYEWLFIVSSLLIFSPVQFENWLWGLQIQVFLNVLAVTAGAFIVSNCSLNVKAVTGLTGCCLVAVFSRLNGLLLCVCIFLYFLITILKNKEKTAVAVLMIWIAFCSILLVIFFHNYSIVEGFLDLSLIPKKPLEYIKFFITLIGAPLSLDYQNAWGSFADQYMRAFIWGGTGIIIFCCFSAYYIFQPSYEKFKAWSFFGIIGCYSILSAAMTAGGRAQISVMSAFNSRYTTTTLYLWIAVFFMCYSDDFHEKFHSVVRILYLSIIRIIFPATIILFVFFSGINSLIMFQRNHEEKECARLAVLYDGVNPECLANITHPFWTEYFSKNTIPLLKKLGLSVFRNGIPVPVPALSQKDWVFDDNWSVSPFSPVDSHNVENYYYYSYKVDAFGSITSTPIFIKPSASIVKISVVHGFNTGGLKVGIRINTAPPLELLCDLTDEADEWHDYVFDLLNYRGKTFTVFGEVQEGSSKGSEKDWVGIKQPVIYYNSTSPR